MTLGPRIKAPKATKAPKTPKWYETVKKDLCASCSHRLRGIVDQPGRYCKHMSNVQHGRHNFCAMYSIPRDAK